MSLAALLRMAEVPFPGDVQALDSADLASLFHRLNNQLGVILAHAELIGAKSLDTAERRRSVQIVDAALESMRLARAIRERAETSAPPDLPAGPR